MNNRNTRQKEIILTTLSNDKTHPTIQELLDKVQKIDSSIGQATVYRNVSRLVDEGKVLKLPLLNGEVHYDGDNSPHYHFICRKCNMIYDLFDKSYNKTINNIEREYNLKIEEATLIFRGICDKCNEEI